MIKALEKGAQVKTVGGIFGTITGVKDDRFVIKLRRMLRSVARCAISAKID